MIKHDILAEINNLILLRNATETDPFISIHESNSTLLHLADDLQRKCDELEADNVEKKIRIQQLLEERKAKGPSKTENQQREKIEKLQDQLNTKLRTEVDLSTAALNAEKELSKQKEINIENKERISKLEEENIKKEEKFSKLLEEMQSIKSDTELQEKQYAGLKDTVRSLQEENDTLKLTNSNLVERLVTEKESLMDQMNKMNEMIEGLTKERDMLKNYQKNEVNQKNWKKQNLIQEFQKGLDSNDNKSNRKFGTMGVILPTAPKMIIQAHPKEIASIRYDESGSDLLATAGESCVKIWDTGSGLSNTILRGSSHHFMLGVDFNGGTAAGASTDKTARVWNVRTKRMIHHLVGHQHKVTCIRLFNKERSTITGSADRSMKVWDISQSTYRQKVTIQHSSTTNGIDVSSGGTIVVSGHFDGGVRCWDLRSGERIFDLQDIHLGGVTSVQMNPSNEIQVLTMGRDSTLKMIDLRTSETLYTFQHTDFRVFDNHAACAISPDATYAACGSASNSHVFVWNLLKGKLESRLKAHNDCVVSVAWGSGGTNGQQFASVDKKGKLVLWQ